MADRSVSSMSDNAKNGDDIRNEESACIGFFGSEAINVVHRRSIKHINSFVMPPAEQLCIRDYMKTT